MTDLAEMVKLAPQIGVALVMLAAILTGTTVVVLLVMRQRRKTAEVATEDEQRPTRDELAPADASGQFMTPAEMFEQVTELAKVIKARGGPESAVNGHCAPQVVEECKGRFDRIEATLKRTERNQGQTRAKLAEMSVAQRDMQRDLTSVLESMTNGSSSRPSPV